MLENIIRVNHAGELGASYIYKRQMAMLRNNKRAAPLIQETLNHLKEFDELLITYNVTLTMTQS